MRIIELYEIIFESGFCKTFEDNTCSINSKCRCTCVCRYSLCINSDLSIFLCYFVFLKFCLCESGFQSVFQSFFCRNLCCTCITYGIEYESTIDRNDLCILRSCQHSQHTFLSMNTWIICIRCKSTG